ncbi:MAG: hypothetical protein KC933_35390, partial [Myxococcales bacterium]|nr:hypothetical protein [Myxococcales bacterium]
MLHSYLFNARGGVKFHGALSGGLRMDVRFACALLCAGAALGAAPPLPAGPPVARRVAKLASGDYGVHLDPTLSKVARDLAHAATRDFGSAEPGRVKAALRKEGLADTQILPFIFLGITRQDLTSTAVPYARHLGPARGAARLGLGVA